MNHDPNVSRVSKVDHIRDLAFFIYEQIVLDAGGHFLRKLLLDGRRFPKNASRSTAVSLGMSSLSSCVAYNLAFKFSKSVVS